MIVAALTRLDWGSKTRAVRINGPDTPWCHDDLIEVVTGAGAAIDIVIVPKVKAPRDVWFIDTLLNQLEDKLGLENGRIGLEVLIEEAQALARVEEIAGCCARLEALTLGFGDLSASQGIRTGHVGEAAAHYPGDMWHYARNRLIVAARANGLDAIDGPNANYRDLEGYRTDATWASTLGAVGKWAIHPSQIAIANEVFSPTARRGHPGPPCRRGCPRRRGRGIGCSERRWADDRCGDGAHLPDRSGSGGGDRPGVTGDGDRRIYLTKVREMSDDQDRHVRQFNRTVTQRIGALSDRYLARDRPLGASRVLWEVGPDGTDVRAIRARLGLDSGYLSRLLRTLEDQRLVTVEPDADDQRVRVVRLTKAGVGRARRARPSK